MSALIPEEIKAFILAHIDSIAELEALLVLRENSGQSRTCKEVADRIYCDEKTTAAVLHKLISHGLIAPDAGSPGRFRYQQSTPEHTDMLNRLADVYARYVVPITTLVHNKSKRHIKSFADAFKLKKGDGE